MIIFALDSHGDAWQCYGTSSDQANATVMIRTKKPLRSAKIACT